jgi:hypothetical protein
VNKTFKILKEQNLNYDDDEQINNLLLKIELNKVLKNELKVSELF